MRTTLSDVVIVWNANIDATNVVMLELVRANMLVLTYKNNDVDFQLNVSTHEMVRFVHKSHLVSQNWLKG